MQLSQNLRQLLMMAKAKKLKNGDEGIKF